ncbi:MAG TPA: SulP family inorganic anion transporter [Sandaracinaceae bacterium LLY-WYZ-13_1]|nr:SulP family inorganic anion transporter [Sandaracinaceae bacterium LLY-WYZ-13_1]
MSTSDPKNVPRTNLRGLASHWRNDLIAGFSVALVALPLALGIAMAAGAPPISGLLSSVVGGLLTTFLRGSHVAVNGPGNGLIVIVATAFTALGGPEAFPHVLGAVVVAGAVQVAFGLLRLGKLGDMVPAAVIQGMLAAIGLIIVGKQLHVLVGQESSASSPIGVFRELPESFANLNPYVALIGVLSVLVVVLHPKVKTKLVHFVPAPLWVVLIAVPLVLLFNFLQPHSIQLLGRSYHVGPELLVSIPDDLIGSLEGPDFTMIDDPSFWMVVFTFSLVNSIENIVSVKAVDKLDSYRRQSSPNRDLVAVGLSTMTAGMIGALPVLTVIARSSVNVNHGAHTGWSNFFHGAILLVFVVFLAPLMQEIPLAALAGILVYTGYKLTAPKVIADTLHKGPDHFLIFCVTLTATLVWGLLVGILVGVVAELVSHLVILGLPPRESFLRLWQTKVEKVEEKGEPHLLRVRGVANYLNIPRLRNALEDASEREHLIVDFTPALLIDNTLLEYTHDFGRRYEHEHEEGRFDVIGLEAHRAISDHPDALHVLERPLRERRLTPRQQRIRELAEENGWEFEARRDWDPSHLDEFHFFRVHPVEYRDTVVRGSYDLDGDEPPIEWTVSDVTFDEGVLMPEVYHTTAQVLHLPFELPELILEREEILDRVLELAGFQDIDFRSYTSFSKKFVLKGPDEASIRRFMTPRLLEFFESEEIYHLESNGHEIVVFKFMRLASPREVEGMLDFSERLCRLLQEER